VELVQDVIVALVALGAVALVVRRVVGEFRDDGAEAACDHCAVNPDRTSRTDR
jgi:hypothetical protein